MDTRMVHHWDISDEKLRKLGPLGALEYAAIDAHRKAIAACDREQFQVAQAYLALERNYTRMRKALTP